MRAYTTEEILTLLGRHGVNPTVQRLEIARALFSRCAHMSAEEIFVMVNAAGHQVSKATIYNTVGLFAEKGLVREVIVDPNKVFYDPNIAPHHHFYNVVTGELMDIAASEMELKALPQVPPGTCIEGVDVIVRLKPVSSPASG